MNGYRMWLLGTMIRATGFLLAYAVWGVSVWIVSPLRDWYFVRDIKRHKRRAF